MLFRVGGFALPGLSFAPMQILTQRFGQPVRARVLTLLFVLPDHRRALADGCVEIQQPTKEFSCRILGRPWVR